LCKVCLLDCCWESLCYNNGLKRCNFTGLFVIVNHVELIRCIDWSLRTLQDRALGKSCIFIISVRDDYISGSALVFMSELRGLKWSLLILSLPRIRRVVFLMFSGVSTNISVCHFRSECRWGRVFGSSLIGSRVRVSVTKNNGF
jgi:hypothetical protein